MSRINQFNTAVKTDLQRKMEKSPEPINRYMALVDKALMEGHSYPEIIAELEAEKQRILTAPFPGYLPVLDKAKARHAKMACLQGIDGVLKDLMERNAPKEN